MEGLHEPEYDGFTRGSPPHWAGRYLAATNRIGQFVEQSQWKSFILNPVLVKTTVDFVRFCQ